MDLSQYLEIFIDETKEHVQNLNQSLLQLEKNPNDMVILNEIFRVAHTLKGMAGTMGFTKMTTLTHDMEDVLQSIRSGEIKISTKLVDILFKCLDGIEQYLNSIINSGNEGDVDCKDIIAILNKIKETKTIDDFAGKQEEPVIEEKTVEKGEGYTSGFVPNVYEQNVINKALEMKMNAYNITIMLNKGCVLKAARAFIIFQTLERYCEIIKSIPLVEDIEDEKFDFEFTVIVVTRETQEFIDKELNSIAEVEKIIITPLQANQVEEIKTNDNKNAETFIKEEKAQPEPVEVVSKGSENLTVEENVSSDEDSSENKDKAVNSQASNAVKASKTGKTVRVDIGRLDVLMNLVSELIIIKTRLEGLEGVQRTQNYNEAVEYLERITTNLHDAVMKVRMVPVEMVFNRFPRMIRDLARETQKEINLIMSGEETELDRTVIDEIGDPLIHLLRNSADHGIEIPEKRTAQGKNPAGTIYLRAYQDGNNVVIEVEDDGNGIDLEKVKNKAIASGISSKDSINNLSKTDLINLLFKPSFSTAEKITDISGRGVGLDVVKTKIEALGGVIEVESEKGKGSKFIIRLPLTLAIIQALLVMIGEEKFAIPLSSIREIINVKRRDIKMVQNQEVILLRNTIIPIINLGEILDVPNADEDSENMTVVIVNKGEKLSGFLVDNLVGQQEIVIKSLGKLLLGIKCIAGATILGDGQVALIIDVNSLA